MKNNKHRPRLFHRADCLKNTTAFHLYLGQDENSRSRCLQKALRAHLPNLPNRGLPHRFLDDVFGY